MQQNEVHQIESGFAHSRRFWPLAAPHFSAFWGDLASAPPPKADIQLLLR